MGENFELWFEAELTDTGLEVWAEVVNAEATSR